MMSGNSFADRAAPLPNHQIHYQQSASHSQFPQQIMQELSAPDFHQHDQYSPDLQGKSCKSSNVKGTIGGGLLGFALTGQLTGLAGGAMIGNLHSNVRNDLPQRAAVKKYTAVQKQTLHLKRTKLMRSVN
jgi:hypothetical protein